MHIVLICLATLTHSSATEALKERETEIRKLLPAEKAPLAPAVKKQLEKVMTQMVDLEQMAKSSLGEKAETLAANKRKEFVEVFGHRFATASTEQVELFRTNQIEYREEQPASDGTVKVPTAVPTDDDQSEVVYVMKEDKGSWRIEDVVVDGVSTVNNFKQAFSRVIAKEGIDALISRLRKESVGKAPAPAAH